MHANGGHSHDSMNGTLTINYNHPQHHDNFDNINNHHNHQYINNEPKSSYSRDPDTNDMTEQVLNDENLPNCEIDLMNREQLDIKEREQLMEISLLRKKLQETENAMANIIAQMGQVPAKGQVRN